MWCDWCVGERFAETGRGPVRRQPYRCTGCGRRLTARTGSAFSWYRFPDGVIAPAVRSYLQYRLSLASSGQSVAHLSTNQRNLANWRRASASCSHSGCGSARRS